MLRGTDCQPEEITNTVSAANLHSWPGVNVSLQTQGGASAQSHDLHIWNLTLALSNQN